MDLLRLDMHVRALGSVRWHGIVHDTAPPGTIRVGSSPSEPAPNIDTARVYLP